jgi:hypothetical protein
MSTLTSPRNRPSRGELLAWAALLNGELLLLGVYVLWTDVVPARPLYYVYPFVWINVAVWALRRVETPAASRGWRALAGAVAAGYFLLLAYVGGLFAVGTGGYAGGLRLVLWSFPPGWGPAVIYNGPTLAVFLTPFKLLGYLALASLVYVTVLDAAGGALAGLPWLLACTLPVIAGVLSGFVGGSSALVSAASGGSYALSTAAFVLAVVLLVRRPTAADARRLREVIDR